MDAVVLVSGGLDSATVLALAVREGRTAHALTVAYGQRHAIEVDRARALARDLGAASHKVVPLDLRFLQGSALTDAGVPVPKGVSDPGDGVPVTYVPARNTLFLALALAWAESIGAREVWLGVNAVDYSGYPDCREEFLEAFETTARLGTRAGTEGTPIRIVAPLIRMTKAEIVRAALDLGVDVAVTLSCYDPAPSGQPCGACEACRIRRLGFEAAGRVDPSTEGSG